MKIAVIPARGGSKRIPRKNIKEFFGKPIINYSIEAALKSKSIDKVIVSTDDEEIANIARSAGAEVPFLRPEKLSDDHATTMDVIIHALNWAEEATSVEAICCLYATAPFVTSNDLDAAFTVLKENKSSYVFSAAEFPFPIQRAFTLIDEKVEMIQPEHLLTRSQDLVPTYHDAGQFYWCHPTAVHNEEPIFAPHSAVYLMDRSRVQDIDTLEDWDFAERLFSLSQ